MWQRTIDCLGLAVAISSEIATLAAPLTAVFRTYADTTRPPDLRYTLEPRDWPSLVRDGALVGRHDTAMDLVPALELDLYAQVTARAEGVVLHAAAIVGAGGRALVFAGRSGAGKSTLVRALLERGFAYLTEECVALFERGRCRGLARALHVDDPTIAVPAGFGCNEYVLRQGDGLRHTRLFHPPESAIWRAEARAVALIVIDHAPEAPNTVELLRGGESLAAVWPLVFRPDPDALAAAPAALAGYPRYLLRTTTPQHAEALVLMLAEQLDVIPC